MRSLRDQRKARRVVWANGQVAIWRETGLVDAVEEPIVISFDYAPFEELTKVLAKPFDDQPEFADYADPPKPEERVCQTFCGT